MKKIKHKDKKCNVKGCKNPAQYWIPTETLSGQYDLKGKHTFYLCAGHMEHITDADMIFAHFLNLETGVMQNIEVGVYSCSEECNVCN